jgi:hypothetical protein
MGIGRIGGGREFSAHLLDGVNEVILIATVTLKDHLM